MGMDVYGKNPTTETGSYFRNSVWGWKPLASYVTTAYPEITAGCTYWYSNDGDGLDAAGATALADALDRDLANGRIAEYAAQREVYLSALPDEECWLCHGSGIRTDERGCNGCSGTGRAEPFERSYGFSADNMSGFAAFLRDCGGFEIC